MTSETFCSNLTWLDFPKDTVKASSLMKIYSQREKFASQTYVVIYGLNGCLSPSLRFFLKIDSKTTF